MKRNRWMHGLVTAALLGAGVVVAALPAEGQKAPAAGAESQYIGSEACANCHQAPYEQFRQTAMGKIFLLNPRTPQERQGCEACHGPGRAHADAKGKLKVFMFGKDSLHPVDEQNLQCLECHEKGNRMFWRGSQHESRGLACVTCHQVHQRAAPQVGSARFLEPLTENHQFVKTTQMEVCFQCHQMRRAQLQRSAHMPVREGKVTCANCHNPHGTPYPKLLKTATTNETCYGCHAERRGTFLWEHPPVMENCLNCHEPHGSNNPQLLVMRAPRLCERCHVASFHPSTPQPLTSIRNFNRACTNCHSNVHGSNHPSGFMWHR